MVGSGEGCLDKDGELMRDWPSRAGLVEMEQARERRKKVYEDDASTEGDGRKGTGSAGRCNKGNEERGTRSKRE